MVREVDQIWHISFANKIKNNEPITVYNEGKMSRDMTCDDICDGIIKV